MEDYKLPSQNFLIIDLGASLPYTHHKHSIYAFASLLSNKNIGYQIWVPIGSEIDVPNFSIRKILLAGTHAPEFKLFKIKSWPNSILNKTLIFTLRINSKFLIRQQGWLISNYLKFLSSRVKHKYSGIIFTTACPFAINAVYALEAGKINTAIYFRLTNTSETRGALAKTHDFNKLIENSKNFNHVKIRFGIETEQYLTKLNSEHNSKFYISPFPHIEKPNKSYGNDKPFTISFLGYPTKDKGHDQIFPIVEKVSKLKPNYKWQIQLYENDPIHIPLKKLNTNILIVNGKITSLEMAELMNKTDILCLPYNPKSFDYHASAMHYSAMDHAIPVFCFKGSTFAYDIFKFNSGFVSENLQGMCDALVDIRNDQIVEWKNGCQKYNSSRDTANEIFLSLKVSE